MNKKWIAALGVVLVFGLSVRTATAALLIVQDGDDLAAVVNAANSGDVVEIHSNETFVGMLSVSAKELTIQAGAGFSPTVKGSPDSDDSEALKVFAGDPLTRVSVFGISFEPGDEGGFEGAVVLSGTGSTPRFTEAVFIGNTFSGRLEIGGTGLAEVSAQLTGNTMEDETSVSGTGDSIIDVELTGNIMEGELSLSGTGDSVLDARVMENEIRTLARVGGTGDLRSTVALESNTLQELDISTTGGAQVSVEARRNRILDGGLLVAAISSSSLDVLIESCLIVGAGAGSSTSSTEGATVRGHATARFVNDTIAGFDTGISNESISAVSWENMLLLSNGSDIGSGISSGDIANSLLSDGTYDGVNGNFAAVPDVNADFELQPGSPGIDAGNNAAPGLGSLDLSGNSRITDGDGDGLAIVDVGGTEFVTPDVIADDLADVLDDALMDPDLPPDVAAELQDALDGVTGNNAGRANNGALDKWLDGNLVAALTKIRKVIVDLQAAASLGYDTTALQDEATRFGAVAVSTAIAEAAALLGNNDPSVVAARALLAQGDGLRAIGDFLGAVDAYKAAAQALG